MLSCSSQQSEENTDVKQLSDNSGLEMFFYLYYMNEVNKRLETQENGPDFSCQGNEVMRHMTNEVYERSERRNGPEGTHFVMLNSLPSNILEKSEKSFMERDSRGEITPKANENAYIYLSDVDSVTDETKTFNLVSDETRDWAITLCVGLNRQGPEPKVRFEVLEFDNNREGTWREITRQDARRSRNIDMYQQRGFFGNNELYSIRVKDNERKKYRVVINSVTNISVTKNEV